MKLFVYFKIFLLFALLNKQTLFKINKEAPWSNLTVALALRSIIDEKKPVPNLGENISKEMLSFYECCLLRDPSKRWTASKLLEHPFLRTKKSNQVTFKKK